MRGRPGGGGWPRRARWQCWARSHAFARLVSAVYWFGQAGTRTPENVSTGRASRAASDTVHWTLPYRARAAIVLLADGGYCQMRYGRTNRSTLIHLRTSQAASLDSIWMATVSSSIESFALGTSLGVFCTPGRPPNLVWSLAGVVGRTVLGTEDKQKPQEPYAESLASPTPLDQEASRVRFRKIPLCKMHQANASTFILINLLYLQPCILEIGCVKQKS